LTGDAWAVFAWQGLRLRVPSGWELASAVGTQAEGKVRLDDENGPRLEIEWQKKRRFRPELACEKTARRMRERAKKSGRRIELQTDTLDEGRLVRMLWSGDEAGGAFIGYCPRCRRAVRGQVIGASLPEELLADVQLCSCGQPETEWAVYGLRVRLPGGWKLAATVFRPGLIRLRFRRRLAKITVTRWAAAQIVLRDCTLQQWLGEVRKELGLRGCRAESGVRHGHDAVSVRCGAAAWKRNAALWRCDRSHRLFAVVGHGTDADTTEAVVDSLLCHG